MSRFIENKQTVDEFSDHISESGKKIIHRMNVFDYLCSRMHNQYKFVYLSR
jgi:hypothetical protein